LAPSLLSSWPELLFSFTTECLWWFTFCNIPSDERMGLSLINRLGICQVYLSHIHPMALRAHIGPRPPLMSFLNLTLIYSWEESLDGWSARRKAATYTVQHKHRINADKHPCL
jgi:hypothetical protein